MGAGQQGDGRGRGRRRGGDFSAIRGRATGLDRGRDEIRPKVGRIFADNPIAPIVAGAVGAVTGIGTGAGTGARWGSGGPAVGGLSGPVFLRICRKRPSTPCVDAPGGSIKNKRPRIAGPSAFRGADIRQGRNRGDPDVPVGYRRRAVCDELLTFSSLCDVGRHHSRRVRPEPREMQDGSGLNCALRRTIRTSQRGTIHRSMFRHGEPFDRGARGAGAGRACGGADGRAWGADGRACGADGRACGGRRIESMFRHGEPPLFWRGGGGGRFSPPLPGRGGGGRWLCGGR